MMNNSYSVSDCINFLSWYYKKDTNFCTYICKSYHCYNCIYGGLYINEPTYFNKINITLIFLNFGIIL